MKRFAIIIAMAFVALGISAKEMPYLITVENQLGRGHVQGIAYDAQKGRMYFSFTTRFLVTDSEGRITGSIENIHGHLGAMTFDPVGRKVYASLECKDDVIGSSISKNLGKERFKRSSFYIAEIDVDRIVKTDMAESEVIKRIDVLPANEDFAAKVVCGGKELAHRFGCSGIDGVTMGPAFGHPDGKRMFLYVAYGIYGDVNRTDNDYQVLLRYQPGKWDIAPKRYFIKTGNTKWGVQNLAWDKESGLMLMAVYKGKKAQYPNYSLFAVDMASKPVHARLDGVPYQKGKVLTLPLARRGWDFKYGATGMCPVGNGCWYLAESFWKKNEQDKKIYGSNTRLYKWLGGIDTPFCGIPMSDGGESVDGM